MRRNGNVLVLGVGLLIVALLSANLAVNVFGADPTEGVVSPPAASARPFEASLATGVDPGVASAQPVADLLALAEAEEQLLISLYERVSASVVNIGISTGVPGGGGAGSGFVLDEQGHIVTNNHVVEGAERILVRFADDTSVEAEVVGADTDSDLAVIQVDAPRSLLKPVRLGDSEALRVGQRAIAVGNPFGFEQTMTTGIISAVGRVVRQESGFSLPQLIQTDAAINPGNSGGPLLDSQGRVIGVTTLIFSSSGSSAGVGFAVPVNTVKRVVPQLIASGRYADPWLGITGLSVTPDVAEALGLDGDRGVLVRDAVGDGPADKAGLRGSERQIEFEGALLTTGGDIIVALDGEAVRDMDDLITSLSGTAVGQRVTLTVLRDGEELGIELTLEERPVR
jgi:S1-C subfamily serine protease